jgi:aspartate/methionine/tyrosine aminotransferase
MWTEPARRGRTKSSEYMLWAKTRSQSRFNLATSGVMNYPFAGLQIRADELELSGPSWYGYAPLQEALSRHTGAPPECVVAAAGTSMGNHLVMAALLEPGDEVLIEHPAYDPLVAVAEYLGADVKRFARKFGDNFPVDPDEIERAVSPRTKLIVLTNLHNPSSALIDGETLARVGELALKSGAHVLVDEVYLDALFERAPRTAFHLGNQFVVTNSLTKVYGLSGLRCGWVLAAPELAARLWRLNDLFGVIPAHAAERLSVVALENLPRIAERSRSLLEENRRLLNSFLFSRDDLEYHLQEFGTVSFPRLLHGTAAGLCALLAEKYETTVVPGDFFGMPEHIRVGLGGETDALRGGLERLGAALDELRARRP